MVNQEEYEVCKRRGHKLIESEWRRCELCGMWVREISKFEEREDAPAKADREVPSKSIKPLDPAEAAACRRRSTHNECTILSNWSQCQWCGMWLRCDRIIEEREDAPPKDEWGAAEILNELEGRQSRASSDE